MRKQIKGNVCLVQEYVLSLERISESRRQDIIALSAAQRDLERQLRRQSPGPAPGPRHSRHQDTLDLATSADLPAKLRAIVEDNKVLKEKLKTSRARCVQHEKREAALRTDRDQLAQAAARLEGELRGCSVQPAQIQEIKVTLVAGP